MDWIQRSNRRRLLGLGRAIFFLYQLGTSEPNNANNNEDCAVLNQFGNGGEWNDIFAIPVCTLFVRPILKERATFHVRLTPRVG